MKTSKRIVSFVLSAIMVVTTFLAVGPVFTIEASAIELGGISQEHVIADYETVYANYQAKYFKGKETNWPTDIVIPGLRQADDYTPQGMTYWPAKEWILISAYDASGNDKHSVIYAIDINTGDFVALFKLLNIDGTPNISHGGGIAASEYNFYYADTDAATDTGSRISYIPLSEMDVEKNTVKEVRIQGSIDCSGELFGGKVKNSSLNEVDTDKSAATSYCCYDEGVLWTGNFYFGDSASYTKYSYKANKDYNSMLLGYRLQGDSSLEEWHYLSYLTKQNFVPISLNSPDAGVTSTKNNTTMTYTPSKNADGSIKIVGTVNNTGTTAEGEMTAEFATVTLTGGREYVIEFTSTNKLSDMYMFGPTGAHCNVKQSQASTITTNSNSTYTYRMVFTAGVMPSGADSSWPTTATTDGSYTGTYRIRFDQDSISAGSYKEFTISNFTIKEAPTGFEGDSSKEGANCAGNPTYCIAIEDGIDRIQYAMVDKGKIYISRSWDRNTGGTHVRALTIGDMDINVPGTVPLTVNGVERMGYKISSGGTTKEYNTDQMLYMGEALCIIEDYLYMFGEGAAYNYRAKDSSNVSLEPIDVIWKIDQHAIMDSPRSSTEDIEASHYEKVTDLSQLDGKSEYLVVYESPIKDRVTQKNVLYLLDSYGGYNGAKLPKVDNPTQGNTGDSMGSIGYKMTSYTTDGDKLYIDDTVDERKSIRWTVSSSGSQIKLANSDHYYAQNKYFVFNYGVISMATEKTQEYNHINALAVGDGSFYLYSTYGQLDGKAPSYLWCNDGSDPDNTYISRYNEHYDNALSNKVYYGAEEIPGTFHVDALHQEEESSGNVATDYTGLPNGYIYNYDNVYPSAKFTFYKRVPDPHAFTGESQVYTDLKAEVQSDGTLNLNLETYATASLHYKTLAAKRPTDYIFVMDKSGSMDDSEGGAYQPRWRMDSDGDWGKGDLNMATVVGRKDGGPFKVDGKKVMGYDYYSNCYYRTSDGIYRLLKGAVKTTKDDWWDGWKRQLFWVYYQDDSGVCYVLNSSGTFDNRGSYDTFKTMVDNEQNYTYNAHSNSQEGRSTATLFSGMYYTYTSSAQVLSQEQNLAVQMTYDIAADAAATGLDHRIAVCRVGYMPGQGDSNTTTAYYKAGNTAPIALTVTSGFSSSQDFSGVFNSVGQFGTVRTIIDNLVTGGHSHTDYAMKTMVPKMINSSGYDYSYNGTRTVCVVLFTDGGMCSIEDEMSSASASGADAVSGSTIMGAKDIKEAGGQIYTVQVGTEDIGNWDEALQLRCVSSEFVSAKSGSETGEPSPWDVDFYHKVTTSSFNHITESTAIMEQINEGRKYALAKLDANAVLREQLDQESFSFENVSASDITIGTQEAYYDAIGRLQFGETQPDSTITADTSQANNGLITITGFDYSKNYVSTVTADDGAAKKLVITIKNVDFADDVVNMTDVNKPIVDVPVSLAEPTGIYMQNGEKHRSFPEDRVTVPQYTYVFDYGIGMFDVDINGTLISVDTALQKQSTYSYSKSQGNTSLTFSEDKQDMTYTINKDATDMQRYFVLIQRPNGEYDWFAINIVPASTVYYEQSIFAVDPNNNTGAAWSAESDGTQAVTNQDISLWDDVYGYDENYLAAGGIYSGGTALKSTVSSSNKRSQTMKTTFNGYGFDLYSVCGPNTGVQIVKVYPTGTTDKMNFKSYVIDTFYNDTNFAGPLYQVPILHHECAYGNYTVEVTSAYLSTAGALQTQSVDSAVIDENGTVSYTGSYAQDREAMILEELGFEELIGTDVEFIWHSQDSVLNGGKGAQGEDDGAFTTQSTTELVSYIDGIRTYYPGGDNMDAYYKDSEKGATYYNVFDNMKAGVFSGSGISYIYGTSGGQSLNFAEELEKLFEGRPKNEVYLENAGESGITFTVDGLDENSRVMVSLRAAQGSPIAQVNENKFVDGSITKMEMYYDVTDYLGEIVDGKATVIIKNAGNGLLAVDNVKVTGAGGISAQSDLSDVFEILSLDVVEVDPRQPSNSVSSDIGEIPLPPVPDEPDNNDLDDGNDNGNDDITPPSDDNNEDPAEDGFFAKVESFFVKIFNFFKNIFNKVSSFFEF